MAKRLVLFVLCLAVVLTACARPMYVRPYEPVTRTDSLAIHADSVAWEAQRLAKENSNRITGVTFIVLLFVFVYPALGLRLF